MKRHRHSIIAILVGALAATATPPVAGAGVYSWKNVAGGDWDQSGNWSVPGYPTLFFDFAVFNLPGACSVDATDSLRIGRIAGMMAVSGDTRVSVYEGFGGALGVSPDGTGAVFTLARGSIDASGMHTVGPGGVLALGPGTSLRSRSAGSVGVDLTPGGTLAGDGGSIDGHVLRNLGTVSPGMTTGSTGILHIGRRAAAGYLQGAGGVLAIDLAGDEPGAGYDQLRVADGSLGVTLGGELRIAIAPGFTPSPGGRYEVLTAPSYAERFAAITLPELPGRVLDVVYEPGAVVVTVGGNLEIAAVLDLQPGSCVNPLSVGKQGVIPAAVLGTADLAANAIDPASIRLEGVAPVRWHLEDVGGPSPDGCPSSLPDGALDLVMHFDAPAILDAVGPVANGDIVVLHLAGALADGTAITGEDTMSIRGNAKRKSEDGAGAVSNAVGLWAPVRPGDPVQRATYHLPEPAAVRLEVFSVTGERILSLVDGIQAAGSHVITWRPDNRPGGVYFYRLTAGEEVRTARILIGF